MLAALAFTIFTICFLVIALTTPPFVWTGLPDYVALVGNTNQLWPELARAMMLLFGPLYLIILNSLHDIAPPGRQGLARLALLCALGFAILTGGNYFIQLSTVRLGLAHGDTTGLTQVVQANPYGARRRP